MLYDVTSNRITDLDQVEHLALCSNLTSLVLEGNPIYFDGDTGEELVSRHQCRVPSDFRNRERKIISLLLPQLGILDDIPISASDSATSTDTVHRPSTSIGHYSDTDISKNSLGDNSGTSRTPLRKSSSLSQSHRKLEDALSSNKLSQSAPPSKSKPMTLLKRRSITTLPDTQKHLIPKPPVLPPITLQANTPPRPFRRALLTGTYHPPHTEPKPPPPNPSESKIFKRQNLLNRGRILDDREKIVIVQPMYSPGPIQERLAPMNPLISKSN